MQSETRGRPTHLCDQVTALLDEAHQLADIAAPLVQHLVARLGSHKRHDPRRSINLGVHRLGRDQPRQELLRLVRRERQERRQSRERDPRVVTGDDSNVLWVQVARRSMPVPSGGTPGAARRQQDRETRAARHSRVRQSGHEAPATACLPCHAWHPPQCHHRRPPSPPSPPAQTPLSAGAPRRTGPRCCSTRRVRHR